MKKMSVESECTGKHMEQLVNKERKAGWKTDVKILKALFDNTDLTGQKETIASRESQKPGNSKETDDLAHQRRVERKKSGEVVEGHFEIPELFTKPHSNRCMSLVLEGHEVYFSRDVLFLLSPNLCNMVESAILEYSNLLITCEEFVTLLKCVYLNILAPVKDLSSVAILLRLGKRYDIPSVLRKCEDYLMERFVKDVRTLKNSVVVGITLIAEKNNLTRLLEMCRQEAVGRPIKDMTEMSEYRHLSTSTKLRISFNKLQKIDTEWRVRNLQNTAVTKISKKLKPLPRFEVQREPTQIQETGLFLKPQIFHTLTVKICGTPFYASKEIMALASPVFRRMIEDSLTEDRHGNKINNEWAVKMLRKRADETKTKIKRLAESRMGREPIQETDMFMKPQIFHTLTVQICGTPFYASKEIMALASPVFRRKIEDSLTEDRHGNKVIELEEDSVDTFLIILKALHPPHLKCVTESNVREVLKLTEKYQLSNLRDACDKTLLFKHSHHDTDIPMEENTVLYKLAVQHFLPQLRKFVFENIRWANSAEFHSFVADEELPEVDRLHVVNMRLQGLEEIYWEKSCDGDDKHCSVIEEGIIERRPFFETCHMDTDVMLVIGGITLFVNPEVLQIASEYFRERIESFANGKNPGVQTKLEIPIDDDEVDIVKMLGQLYPNMLDTVYEKDALILLRLANKYRVTSLVGTCERALVKDCIARKDEIPAIKLIEYVQIAVQHSLDKLLDTCKSVAQDWEKPKEKIVYIDNSDMTSYYDSDDDYYYYYSSS